VNEIGNVMKQIKVNHRKWKQTTVSMVIQKRMHRHMGQICILSLTNYGGRYMLVYDETLASGFLSSLFDLYSPQERVRNSLFLPFSWDRVPTAATMAITTAPPVIPNVVYCAHLGAKRPKDWLQKYIPAS
jgi:hypothetical protein